MGGRNGWAHLIALLCLLLCACSRPAAKTPTGTASPAATRSATPTVLPGSAGGAPSPSGSPAPVLRAPVTPNAPPNAVLIQASGANSPGQNCCTVNLRTALFNASGSWDLAWSYDCSTLGRDGNLGLDVYRADGSFISVPLSINQIGRGGQGTQQYGQGGGFYIVVNSVWQ